MKRTLGGAVGSAGGAALTRAKRRWARLRPASGEVELAVCATEEAVSFINFFLKPGVPPSECDFVEEVPSDQLPNYPVLAKAVTQLEEYLAGQRTEFDLPLDLPGSQFQKTVWAALQDIPYGETTSYGQLAKRIPGASPRAVGSANAQNPICICVPCHRVLGAKGQLTGYSGGLSNKQWLLRLESKGARILKEVQKKRKATSELASQDQPTEEPLHKEEEETKELKRPRTEDQEEKAIEASKESELV